MIIIDMNQISLASLMMHLNMTKKKEPDEYFLSVKNVRSWIKSSKEQLSSFKSEMRRDVKGAKAKVYSKEGYIRNMQHYLKHGDWIDDFYGEYEEKKVKWKTIHP